MPRGSGEQGSVPPCRTQGAGEGGSAQPHAEHSARMLSCHDNGLRGHSARGGQAAAQPTSSPPACRLFSATNWAPVPGKG